MHNLTVIPIVLVSLEYDVSSGLMSSTSSIQYNTTIPWLNELRVDYVHVFVSCIFFVLKCRTTIFKLSVQSLTPIRYFNIMPLAHYSTHQQSPKLNLFLIFNLIH